MPVQSFNTNAPREVRDFTGSEGRVQETSALSSIISVGEKAFGAFRENRDNAATADLIDKNLEIAEAVGSGADDETVARALSGYREEVGEDASPEDAAALSEFNDLTKRIETARSQGGNASVLELVRNRQLRQLIADRPHMAKEALSIAGALTSASDAFHRDANAEAEARAQQRLADQASKTIDFKRQALLAEGIALPAGATSNQIESLFDNHLAPRIASSKQLERVATDYANSDKADRGEALLIFRDTWNSMSQDGKQTVGEAHTSNTLTQLNAIVASGGTKEEKQAAIAGLMSQHRLVLQNFGLQPDQVADQAGPLLDILGNASQFGVEDFDVAKLEKDIKLRKLEADLSWRTQYPELEFVATIQNFLGPHAVGLLDSGTITRSITSALKHAATLAAGYQAPPPEAPSNWATLSEDKKVEWSRKQFESTLELIGTQGISQQLVDGVVQQLSAVVSDPRINDSQAVFDSALPVLADPGFFDKANNSELYAGLQDVGRERLGTYISDLAGSLGTALDGYKTVKLLPPDENGKIRFASTEVTLLKQHAATEARRKYAGRLQNYIQARAHLEGHTNYKEVAETFWKELQ